MAFLGSTMFLRLNVISFGEENVHLNSNTAIALSTTSAVDPGDQSHLFSTSERHAHVITDLTLIIFVGLSRGQSQDSPGIIPRMSIFDGFGIIPVT